MREVAKRVEAEAAEMVEWCENWQAGQYAPAPTADGWTVEMHGLVDDALKLAEKSAALARAYLEAADQRDEALAALKDEMQWDMGGVPENEWKRRYLEAEKALREIAEQVGTATRARQVARALLAEQEAKT